MNKLLKKVSVLLLFLVMSIGLVSCGNNNQKGVNDVNASAKSEMISYPIKITDSFGKEITLEKEPQKVISVAPNITEIIHKLGAEEKIAGRTDYCDYPEQVKNVESIGTVRKPDIEKIIGLEPDLVIASTHFDEENTAKLEEAGLKVIALYEENDVNGVYNMINILGTALNKQSESNEIVEEMKSSIDKVTEAVSGLEEPSVYYVVGYGEGGDFSAPANTFVGQLIKLAGGNNIVPESDNWSFSLEVLLEKDPDIIIVRSGEKENFISTEGYKELTAVKEDRVYEIDNNLLDRQGYRNSEGVFKLAQIFHPEALKE
ncbi:MAG: ABC transporter substrate-binding protein [Clostridium butyricum]|nr:ABC transporter substrate-binding protein [Clostridium butyricum]